MHRTIEPKVLYFGTPVVLVSTRNEDGSANLAPMSSAWWVGQSGMLGLDRTSRTTENLDRTGECVLNLTSSALAGAVDRLALLTGTPVVPEHKMRKGYRYEPDKFAAAGLSPMPSQVVAAPRVAESPIQLEARVTRTHPFEDQDSGLVAVETRVVRVHVEEELLVPGGRHHIDADRWDPLIMKFCEFYGNGQNLRPSRLATAWGIPGRTGAVRG
ncbi:flavin reductase family protein [Streptomyces sp. NPDC046831]|uniref:flavin reductase family protein n=1 Tax=Streptomyces sp. NPDC046831 TaxID=3154805 RepID=UPI0033D92037